MKVMSSSKRNLSTVPPQFYMLLFLDISSIAQLCPTLCDPVHCSMPGLSVHHQLLEFTQTPVHRVSDAIPPSHALSSPSPAFNLSQHQGLCKWVISPHQVYKVLELQLQHQSLQWIFKTDPLESKRLSRVFSNTPVQKHQFFRTQLSLWSNSQHPYMTTGKTIALARPLLAK